MTGPLSTISTALSALRYNRVGLDVAAGNVANVGSESYARRRVEAEAIAAPVHPAMWSRYEAAGTGVRVAGVNRLTDPFLDARCRQEHGNQSYLDVQQAAMERLETGINEPGDNGVAAALAEFRSSWHDLANSPASDAIRNQVISKAETLTEILGAQVGSVQSEAADLRGRAVALVAQVNGVAADLAATNKAIFATQAAGGDAGSLLDSRDQMAMELAKLTGAQSQLAADGHLNVTLNGQALVTAGTASQLQLNGIAADGTATAATVSVTIVSATSSSGANAGGELGATADLLNNVIPDYLTGLNDFAKSLADSVNTQHSAGYDASGTAGSALFTYTAGSEAATLQVAISDPAKIAAAGTSGGVVDGENAQAMADTSAAESKYQQLVSQFGTKVAAVRRLATNQTAMTNTVDDTREQLSGIDTDEEMAMIVTFQRGYEAAAKVLTVVDSLLDTLINRTGIVR